MTVDQKLNIEIAGNTVQLDRSLKNINMALQNSKREAQALSKELKFEPGNAELLAKRQKELAQAVGLTNEKIKLLNDELDKVDPDVDPTAYFRLQRQIQIASRESRALTQQIGKANASLERMKNTASTFEFDPGNGVVAFQNTIRGVDAALSSLGSVSDIVNFDRSTASTQELQSNLEQITKATDLLQRKASLLQGELSDIDVSADPVGFQRIQTQIHSVTEQISKLESAKVDIPVGIASIDVNVGDGVTSMRDQLATLRNEMRSIGDVADLVNFNVAEASIGEVTARLTLLKRLSAAMTSEISLLKSSLVNIDPKIDPKTFIETTARISQLQTQLNTLDNTIVDAEIVLRNDSYSVTNVVGRFVSKLHSLLSSGLNDVSERIVAPLTSTFERVGSTIGSTLARVLPQGVSRGLTAVTAAMSTGLSNVTSKAISGVSSVASRIGSVVGPAISKVGSTIGSVGASIFSSVGSGLAETLKAPFRGIASGIGTIVQGAFLTIGNKITNSITSTVNGAMKTMENSLVSFKSLNNVLQFQGVDEETIQNLTNDIKAFSNESKFGADNLSKVVKGLSASGIEAQRTAELTKSIASSYALLGDGSRNIADIGVIFSQINSASKLMAEDFNQLRDAGIGGALKQEIERSFPDIIAQFGGFNEAMSEGAITAEMVNEAITKIGSSDAAKKAASVPNSMSEAFGILQKTLGSKFQSVYNDLSSRGIDFIGGLNATLANLDITPFVSIIESAVQSFDKVKQYVAGLFSQIDFSGLIGKVSEFGSNLFNALTNQKVLDAVGGIWESVKGLTTSIVDLATSPAIKTFVDGFVQVLASGAETLASVFNQVGQIIVSVFGGIDFTTLTTPLVAIIELGKSFFTSVLEPLQKKLNEMNEAGTFDKIWSNLKSIGNVIGKIIKSLSPFVELIGKLIGWLAGELFSVGITLLTAFVDVVKSLADVLDRIFKAVGKVAGNVLDWLSGVFNFSDYSVPSSAGYSTYSTVSGASYNSTNNVTINVSAPSGIDTNSLARAIRHEFELNLA